jgi:hypothetical protein
MGQAKEDDEKLRLRQAADLAYRQSLAFYPYLPEVALGYIQLLETVKRHDDALRVAELLLHHDPDNASIQYLVRQLRNMN